MLKNSDKGKIGFCIKAHNGFFVGDETTITETMCMFHANNWSTNDLMYTSKNIRSASGRESKALNVVTIWGENEPLKSHFEIINNKTVTNVDNWAEAVKLFENKS